MILTKISFRNKSFQNEFIPVVAPNRNFRFGTKSSQTFHEYHVKEIRAHSGMELGTWIGWANQLTDTFADPPVFSSHFCSKMGTTI